MNERLSVNANHYLRGLIFVPIMTMIIANNFHFSVIASFDVLLSSDGFPERTEEFQ